ncbi:hypothetical protein NDN08_004506 [Rhodosorus marinus]|uniref:Uncharacterized protein n=1 Tax=Rhodosorus marinus TaxID=101924 RepID=A0AAV8UQN8_9RHOD|nr:hypothetical protein NDN08_004506 [Rhodosorus marinus]
MGKVVVGLLGLALFAVVSGAPPKFTLEHARILRCEQGTGGVLTEAFEVLISRPRCTYECHEYFTSIDDLTNEVSRAEDCHRATLEYSLACYEDPNHDSGCGSLDPNAFQPTSQAEVEQELEDKWEPVYENVLYDYSCKIHIDGEKKLCASSQAIMAIVNGIAMACAGRDESELDEVVLSEEVLSCDSPHTLPISDNQFDPDLLDVVEDPAPVDDPDTCPTDCTSEEKEDLYEYYLNLLSSLEDVADEMLADQNEMSALSLSVYNKADGSSYHDAWMRKFDQLSIWIAVTVERKDEAVARIAEVEADLDTLVQLNPWLEGSSRIAVPARKMASAVREISSDHRCLDKPECDGHIWKKQIWLHNQCRSICISYICTDRLTLRYCLEKTLNWGLTNKKCHANQYTRRKCFDAYS